ncbi:MAG: AI-2E family transporter [Euryarchaeota archaeon]|nr:AI-2E family transporter [Euryarchaeota archaeon]
MKRRAGILLALAMTFALVTLAPLLDALVSAAVISYLTYPLYRRFQGIVRNSALAALLTTVVFALPFLLGFLYLAFFIIQQGQEFTRTITGEGLSLGSLLGSVQLSGGGLSLSQFTPHLSSLESGTLLLVKLTVFLISMYYFTTEYPRLREGMERLIKEEETETTRIFFHSMDRALKGMLYGYVLTSFLVILMSSIAYTIVGISNAFLFGFLTGIFGILPILGAWMVYIPLGAYLIYTGYPIEGVGIIVFGIIFINIIQDFYIRPRLTKNAADVHPMFTIIGFIAGPMKFGLFGLILGPLALGFLKGVIDGVLQYYLTVARGEDD